MLNLFNYYYLRLKNFYRQVWPALIVAQKNQPKQKINIIIISGVVGHDFCAQLCFQLLKNLKQKTALITADQIYLSDQDENEAAADLLQNASLLNQFVTQLANQEYQFLIIQTDLLAAFEWRNAWLKPKIVCLTNFDYYQIAGLTESQTLKAQSLWLKNAASLILNADDPMFNKIRKKQSIKKQQQLSVLSWPDQLPTQFKKIVNVKFPEASQQIFAYLAIEICKNLAISSQDIKTSLEKINHSISLLPIQTINDQQFHYYPSTHPKAVSLALKTLKEKQKIQRLTGRIIAILPVDQLSYQMSKEIGQILVEDSNVFILTSQNINDQVWHQIRQIKEQLTEGQQKIISQPNLNEAINFYQQKIAKRGDLTIIFNF